MRRVPILLSAAVVLSATLPAFSQQQQAQQAAAPAPRPVARDAFVYYNYGIMHYQARDYASAAKSLETAVNYGMSKSPAARYVLGNAYFLTDKRDDALSQYGNASKIDPNGQAGIYSRYCANWINVDNARRAQQNAVTPAIKVDDQEVKASLPALPSIDMERPSPYEVSQWTDAVRAQYAGQAQSKIITNNEKLTGARQLYLQAQSACSTLVPNTPDRGETGAAFTRRRQAYSERSQQLLKPYQEYAVACQERLKDSNRILDACRMSYKRLNNEMPSTAWGR